jgi:hypothetical protein
MLAERRTVMDDWSDHDLPPEARALLARARRGELSGLDLAEVEAALRGLRTGVEELLASFRSQLRELGEIAQRFEAGELEVGGADDPDARRAELDRALAECATNLASTARALRALRGHRLGTLLEALQSVGGDGEDAAAVLAALRAELGGGPGEAP